MEKVPIVQRVTDSQGRKTIVLSQNTAITFSLSLLVSIIMLVAYVVNGVDSVTNRVSTLERSDENQQKQISQLEEDNVTAKVNFSEIMTKLESIDASIQQLTKDGR